METELRAYQTLDLDILANAVVKWKDNNRGINPDIMIIHPITAREFYHKAMSKYQAAIDMGRDFDLDEGEMRVVTINLYGATIRMYTSFDITKDKFILK